MPQSVIVDAHGRPAQAGTTVDISLTTQDIRDRYDNLGQKAEQVIKQQAQRAMDQQGRIDPRHIFLKQPKPKGNALAPQAITEARMRALKDDWNPTEYIVDLYELYLKHGQRQVVALFVTFETYLRRCLLAVQETQRDLVKRKLAGKLTKGEYNFNMEIAKMAEDAIKNGIQKERLDMTLRLAAH